MSKAELVKKLVNEVNKKPKHNIIINAHMHIWNFDCIPEEFQNRYQGIPGSFDIVQPFLKKFQKVYYKDEDIFDKTLDFLKICRSRTLEKVVDALREEGASLPANVMQIFTPLMMDMVYAARDTEKQPQISFHRQMRMTKNIVLKYPGRFLPFIAADPRRISAYKAQGATNGPHGIGYITKALEREGFWGVKIYPPLGYEPADPDLLQLYKY